MTNALKKQQKFSIKGAAAGALALALFSAAAVPANAQQGSAYGPNNPSPFAGRIIDTWPTLINGCDTNTGVVYQFQLQKVVNQNGGVDVIRNPVSRNVGFQERVNPISCRMIEGLASAQQHTYASRSQAPNNNGVQQFYNY